MTGDRGTVTRAEMLEVFADWMTRMTEKGAVGFQTEPTPALAARPHHRRGDPVTALRGTEAHA